MRDRGRVLAQADASPMVLEPGFWHTRGCFDPGFRGRNLPAACRKKMSKPRESLFLVDLAVVIPHRTKSPVAEASGGWGSETARAHESFRGFSPRLCLSASSPEFMGKLR